MTRYKLYLESGPQQKKTMVHILDLMGCIANGPTTEMALEKTPAAIHAYLSLLQRHGEAVDLSEPIETQVAAHIMEGSWLGNGDPSLVFEPDLVPLTQEEMERYLQRLAWTREELISLVEPLSEEELTAEPDRGRSLKHILEHIFGAEYSAVRTYGKLDEIRGPDMNRQRSKEELLQWMSIVRASEIKKLRSLPSQEHLEPTSKYARTLRQRLRRILEHEWEHLVEVRERLQPS